MKKGLYPAAYITVAAKVLLYWDQWLRRDKPLTRPTNQTCQSNVAFYKLYCISYPSICTALDKSACRINYYLKIFPVKPKAHPEFCGRIP